MNLKKKDLTILDHTFSIYQLPLRYTSEIFDYQAMGKMLPYELKVQIIIAGCRLLNEQGLPMKELDEQKITELFGTAPYQFHILCKSIAEASFEDDKKKAEQFLKSLVENKPQPSENQTS